MNPNKDLNGKDDSKEGKHPSEDLNGKDDSEGGKHPNMDLNGKDDIEEGKHRSEDLNGKDYSEEGKHPSEDSNGEDDSEGGKHPNMDLNRKDDSEEGKHPSEDLNGKDDSEGGKHPNMDLNGKDDSEEGKLPSKDLNGKDGPEGSKCPKPKTSNPLRSSRSVAFSRLGRAPSERFWDIAIARDEESRLVPCPTDHGLRGRLSGLARKISWKSLKMMAKEWFRNPMNWALLVWIIAVTVSGAIMFLILTGMLNHAIPKKSVRMTWFEVFNQVINALFTLMCIYEHPQRIYQLVLLFRWNSTDILKLRKIYCKDGTYKPHEWAHMLVVVLLLNLNSFAQYVVCGFIVGFKPPKRPALGIGITLAFVIASAMTAGVYTTVSPLGKDYDFPNDEEAQISMKKTSSERKRSFMVREDGKIIETNPLWKGGILDFCDDISITFLSLFCCCCVFGWNMKRLGFGSKYIHITMFVLFCSAPFWIFNLAALNIKDDTTRKALGLTGLLLLYIWVILWWVLENKNEKTVQITGIWSLLRKTSCF